MQCLQRFSGSMKDHHRSRCSRSNDLITVVGDRLTNNSTLLLLRPDVLSQTGCDRLNAEHRYCNLNDYYQS